MKQVTFWEKESFFAHQDIIIIGAGFMGLWSAFELHRQYPKLKITILERNVIPKGASTRNAGFACFGSPTELIHDAGLLGVDEMLNVAAMRFKGIQKIRTYFTDEQIGLDPCGGYECILNSQISTEELDEKTAWLNGLFATITGKAQTFIRNNSKMALLGLKGFDNLIENSLEASIHSGNLVHTFMSRIRNSGIQILTGIEIAGWESLSDSIVIETKQSIRFTCNQLLFCTNAFTSDITAFPNIIPARGQVIVTSPIPDLALRGTFHFDEGFYYWRNLGDRILLGGARNQALDEERTNDLTVTDLIQHVLEHFLQQHIASTYQYRIDYRWSGIMGFTDNKKPFAGSIGKGVYVAIACNGMGVALSPLIAEEITALMSADI